MSVKINFTDGWNRCQLVNEIMRLYSDIERLNKQYHKATAKMHKWRDRASWLRDAR